MLCAWMESVSTRTTYFDVKFLLADFIFRFYFYRWWYKSILCHEDLFVFQNNESNFNEVLKSKFKSCLLSFHFTKFLKLLTLNKIATDHKPLFSDTCKRKWKNLRDSYTKYLRSFRTGTKTSRKYQYWAHAHQMDFLKPFQGPSRYTPNTSNKNFQFKYMFLLSGDRQVRTIMKTRIIKCQKTSLNVI